MLMVYKRGVAYFCMFIIVHVVSVACICMVGKYVSIIYVNCSIFILCPVCEVAQSIHCAFSNCSYFTKKSKLGVGQFSFNVFFSFSFLLYVSTAQISFEEDIPTLDHQPKLEDILNEVHLQFVSAQ